MIDNSLTKIKYYIDNRICPVCQKDATTYHIAGEGYFVECSTCTPFYFPEEFMRKFIASNLDDHKKYKITDYVKKHSRFINMTRIKNSGNPEDKKKALLYKNLHYPLYKKFEANLMEKYFAKWKTLV